MRNARSLSILSLFVVSLAALVPAACGPGTESTGTGASSGTENTGAGTGTAGSGTTNNGGAGGSGASAAGGANTTTSTGTTGSPPTSIAECEGHVYECGDLMDNDGDGLIDSQDPDCLGPCDNTEGGYYGGIPGQAGPPCSVDCYWDQDSGAGNDNCYWNHKCDPNEVDDPGHPEPNVDCSYDTNAQTPGTGSSCDELLAMQSDVCESFCGPLTPNGCDCFGCCELPAGSGKFIWLGSEDNVTGEGSCFADVIDDPVKCEPCIPVPSCYNGCGHCELCIGKTELPPDCTPGGTGGGGPGVGGSGTGGSGSMQCDPGVQACGLPGQDPCPVDYYCITGCCVPISGPK